jgi:predicted helicase
MRRAVAFSSTIKQSKAFTDAFPRSPTKPSKNEPTATR